MERKNTPTTTKQAIRSNMVRVDGRYWPRDSRVAQIALDKTQYCVECRKYHNLPVWPAACHPGLTNGV